VRPDHRRLEAAAHDAAADQAIASPELPFRILAHRALGIFGEEPCRLYWLCARDQDPHCVAPSPARPHRPGRVRRIRTARASPFRPSRKHGGLKV
jgi:hypothetical protein